jgi:hypothetical protein
VLWLRAVHTRTGLISSQASSRSRPEFVIVDRASSTRRYPAVRSAYPRMTRSLMPIITGPTHGRLHGQKPVRRGPAGSRYRTGSCPFRSTRSSWTASARVGFWFVQILGHDLDALVRHSPYACSDTLEHTHSPALLALRPRPNTPGWAP